MCFQITHDEQSDDDISVGNRKMEAEEEKVCTKCIVSQFYMFASKTMDLKSLEHYAAFSINDIGV